MCCYNQLFFYIRFKIFNQISHQYIMYTIINLINSNNSRFGSCNKDWKKMYKSWCSSWFTICWYFNYFISYFLTSKRLYSYTLSVLVVGTRLYFISSISLYIPFKNFRRWSLDSSSFGNSSLLIVPCWRFTIVITSYIEPCARYPSSIW